MPKGIYERTPEARQNIAKAAIGRTPWNKGNHDAALVDSIKAMVDSHPGELTLGDIYKKLVATGEVEAGHPGYKKVFRHLDRAKQSGQVNSACIREGRGRSPHQRIGAPSKFNVGDKVKIDQLQKRTPQWLREELSLNVARTITAVYGTGRFVRYYLGSNRLGSDTLEAHAFRAGELIAYVKGSIGRPRLKRHYNRKLALGNSVTPVGELKACMLAR